MIFGIYKVINNKDKNVIIENTNTINETTVNNKVPNPIVTMSVKNYGTVKIELYPDMAPNTVNNFISLIDDNYYNGLTFHRVEKNILIQGGDKEGTGAGQAEYSIEGEFSENGYTNNTLKFERGTLGLARYDLSSYKTEDKNLIKQGYNSGYSQFFIMVQPQETFNGKYTAFGKVIEGMEIIDRISNLETIQGTSEPVDKPIIDKMTVDTYGKNYRKPKTNKAFNIQAFLQEYYNKE